MNPAKPVTHICLRCHQEATPVYTWNGRKSLCCDSRTSTGGG